SFIRNYLSEKQGIMKSRKKHWKYSDGIYTVSLLKGDFPNDVRCSYSQKIIAYHVILYVVCGFFNILWHCIPGCLPVVYAYRHLFEHSLFCRVLVMGAWYSIYHHFRYYLCIIIVFSFFFCLCMLHLFFLITCAKIYC